MRILVLAESLRINETSSGIVSSTFIHVLCAGGYQVDVLTPDNMGYAVSWLPAEVQVCKFPLAAGADTWLGRIPKVRALRYWITGFGNNFRKACQSWKLVISEQLTIGKYDCIYALGSGSEFVPHFALSELDPAIPWIANFHDPFPWHLYPEPYQKPRRWPAQLIERRVARIMESAARISFPSKLLMDDMAKTFPVIRQKGFVVPHIGMLMGDLPGAAQDEHVVIESGKINLIHAGSLLGPRNPKALLRAIKMLDAEHGWIREKVRFVFIGKVARELKDLVKREKNELVRFYDLRISYRRSLELLRLADAAIVVEADADFSPFMPGKLADMAYARKPVLALTPDKSEVMRLLGKDYPYHSPQGDVAAISRALYKLLTDIRSGNVKADSISGLADYVSIARNKQAISAVLDTLVKKKPVPTHDHS